MYTQLFSSSFGRVVFLRTGFTCAHLKSSGKQPERSDAFIMSVIGLIKTSRHAFCSVVGSGSRSQDLLRDDMIICGWLKRSLSFTCCVSEPVCEPWCISHMPCNDLSKKIHFNQVANTLVR